MQNIVLAGSSGGTVGGDNDDWTRHPGENAGEEGEEEVNGGNGPIACLSFLFSFLPSFFPFFFSFLSFFFNFFLVPRKQCRRLEWICSENYGRILTVGDRDEMGLELETTDLGGSERV